MRPLRHGHQQAGIQQFRTGAFDLPVLVQSGEAIACAGLESAEPIASADPVDAVNNTFVDAGIRSWGGPLALTAVNPFEGMGSLFMPLNPWLSSHDAPVDSVTDYEQPFKPAVGHHPFARGLFQWLAWDMLGVYLLARTLRVRPFTAAFAAQAALLVALPPFTLFFFKGSLSLIMNPALVIPVSLCLGLFCVFWRSSPRTPASAALLAAGFLALGLATLWSDPLFAALFGATLVPFIAGWRTSWQARKRSWNPRWPTNSEPPAPGPS